MKTIELNSEICVGNYAARTLRLVWMDKLNEALDIKPMYENILHWFWPRHTLVGVIGNVFSFPPVGSAQGTLLWIILAVEAISLVSLLFKIELFGFSTFLFQSNLWFSAVGVLMLGAVALELLFNSRNRLANSSEWLFAPNSERHPLTADTKLEKIKRGICYMVGKRKKDKELVRFQFEVDSELWKEMDEIQSLGGMSTKRELINNALTLFRWAALHAYKGNSIAALGADETVYELQMPFLHSIALRGQGDDRNERRRNPEKEDATEVARVI